MDDYKELIEQLLKDSAHYRYSGHTVIGQQYDEAATAIETLLSQLTAAQDKCDALTKAGLIATNRANEALSELSQVKAERDAMLKGLKDAADCDQCKYEPMAMPCEKEVVEFCEECNLEKIPCCGCSGENWEWRGAKEES